MLGALVLLASMASALGDVPTAVAELQFDDGFRNVGAILGEARVHVYAEGEGPLVTPGPWGDCLDMTAASRFGGTTQEQTPAGSALLLGDPALDALGSFSVCFWMRPATDVPEVSSRLLNKSGSWEIMYAGGQPNFVAVQGQDKHGYRFPAPVLRRPGEWTFAAAVVDVAAGQVRLSIGNRTAGLQHAALELTHTPARSEGELQIGNFSGIRPFKGCLDNLRIYDVALSAEQIAEVFGRDAASWLSGHSVYECGVPSVREGGFQPEQSAIFLSSRWQGSKKQETFDMLRDFHATHLHWVYGSDARYMREVHDLGIFYQATVNGLCGWDVATAERSAQGDTTGRQQNLDGDKVVMPHMAKWSPGHPRWTGCHNNPGFRELFWKETAQLVAAGADSIHVDDWEMGVAGAERGDSCFCPACIASFREHLKRSLTREQLAAVGIRDIEAFDYRTYLRTACGIADAQQYKARFRELPLTARFFEFQREGLRAFYAAYRQHLDRLSPEKRISVSVNLHLGKRGADNTFRGAYCVDRFDFLGGEASREMQSAIDYIQPCKTAEAYGIAQVMQTKPITLGPPQAALATTYALGQWFLVPWDLWMDNDATGQPAPRYMGTREDWGPFYDFIHENRQLFDGYRTAALVGVLFNADEAPYEPVRRLCQRLAEEQVPYRLIAAAAKGNRIPIDAQVLNSLRYVIELSPVESFCDEDRRVIETAREARRIRFLSPEDDVLEVLEDASLPCVRVEGPPGIYAFLRVKQDGNRASAVIHVVNWNVLPDGSGPDRFAHVTLSLSPPERWGAPLQVRYHAPGEGGPVVIAPELHPDTVRIPLPRLGTWGVVEVQREGRTG